MRFSSIVRNVADAALSGTAPLAIGDTVAPVAAPSVGVVPNVAAKPARKLSGKAVASAKPATTAKPGKPATAKPADAIPQHGTSSYRGPSPVFRGHDRKLSPIVLDRIPGSFTDRDLAALRAIHAKHKLATFKRGDFDAGVLSRLIGHACIKHVSGNLDQRDAGFAVTAHAVKTRL